MSLGPSFSIRQMIEITGLSEFTLRGWENRYSAFSPSRTETRRREYSKADVERALLLRELVKRGHKIGQIASMGSPTLRRLLKQGGSSSLSIGPENRTEYRTENRPEDILRVLELTALQKWADLETFIKNIKYKNPRTLVRQFLLPTLQALAEGVDSGTVSIAQEHILSSFLKERVYAALSALDRVPRGRRAVRGCFVLAAPEGDHHEITLLLAHLLIRSFGMSSLYVGAHTPSRDLAETALRFNATHVLIVSTVSRRGGAHQDPLAFVRDVRQKVGDSLTILLAGPAAPQVPLDPQAPVLNFNSFGMFEEFLEKMEGKTS